MKPCRTNDQWPLGYNLLQFIWSHYLRHWSYVNIRSYFIKSHISSVILKFHKKFWSIEKFHKTLWSIVKFQYILHCHFEISINLHCHFEILKKMVWNFTVKFQIVKIFYPSGFRAYQKYWRIQIQWICAGLSSSINWLKMIQKLDGKDAYYHWMLYNH